MNYTWNDYSGLVWGQEANSVANKSEYIRKEYARKSLKGLKYKKQKKENWMFCKVYKENQKSDAWKIYSLRWLDPVFFGGYHPTLKLSGIPTFTFIVSLTHRMDNI